MTGAVDTTGWVLIAKIVGVHGVKGNVRLKIFTDSPLEIDRYGPLTDLETGGVYKLTPLHMKKDILISRVEGVADRNTAEALKGVSLYISEKLLKDTENQNLFYHQHLEGLTVEVGDQVVGTVDHIEDHGAGALLALQCDTAVTKGVASLLVPFHHAFVTDVDLEKKCVTIDADYFQSLLSMESAS